MKRHSDDPNATILRSKRDVSRFQILVEIAEHQPAIRQQEVAAILGVTPQAISEYIRELVDEGMVSAQGRGRYEVTREGVEWLLHHAEALESFARHVRRDIIQQVTVWTAIASQPLEKDERVGVFMKGGRLYAGKTPQSASGIVMNTAKEGEDVGITNLDGIIDHHEGMIHVCKIPRVQRGGSRCVKSELLKEVLASAELVAASGIEAVIALKAIGREPDIFFGSCEGVIQAAFHGIECAILIVDDSFTDFLKRLEQARLTYEIHDLVTA
ncbi:MAG: winged helix-turn-helix transcriptional regulator [Methanospirillaceae archaeon]|nr:winged helix-turn-helix transcriptional regulator [Methanospirillaceae archaeon]